MSLVSHAQAQLLVRRHFALDISADHERELRKHLADCRVCSQFYERHLALASLDPAAPSAKQRLALGLGLTAERRNTGFALPAGALAFVAAAAALLLFVLRPAELTSRGGGPEAGSQVLVYRVAAGKVAAPVGSSIARTDELAFAYTNAGKFKRLMIYGQDEHGHVYWYHPAWTQATETPRAVAIEPGPELRELPEAIAHQLDGKHLALHALFTSADVSVRDVERLLQAERSGAISASGRGVVAAALGDALETQIDVAVE